mmetsp:Transcript_82504/g.267271  ORF Transcript_82504/g.267271 Transcript_82504/m.267271 type:complete len:229 (-) Transcript_82504:2663-3349(-)
MLRGKRRGLVSRSAEGAQATLDKISEDTHELRTHVVADVFSARLHSHLDVQGAVPRHPRTEAHDSGRLRQRHLPRKRRRLGAGGRRPGHHQELLALVLGRRLLLDAVQVAQPGAAPDKARQLRGHVARGPAGHLQGDRLGGLLREQLGRVVCHVRGDLVLRRRQVRQKRRGRQSELQRAGNPLWGATSCQGVLHLGRERAEGRHQEGRQAEGRADLRRTLAEGTWREG